MFLRRVLTRGYHYTTQRSINNFHVGRNKVKYAAIITIAAGFGVWILPNTSAMDFQMNGLKFGRFNQVAFCEHNEYLSANEFIQKLTERITAVRNNIRKNHFLGDEIQLPVILFTPQRQNNSSLYTHHIELTYSPNKLLFETESSPSNQGKIDLYQLIIDWLNVVEDDPKVLDQKINQLKDFYTDGKRDQFTTINEKKQNASMRVTKLLSPSNEFEVRVSLYKDNGFSDKDLASIVNGYDKAFNKPTNKVPFRFDSSITTIKPTPKLNQKHGSSSNTSNSAIEGLEALGIQVFTPSSMRTNQQQSKEKLSWSDLAGFESIKETIQETVVMSLQHPAVYDSIAQRTRERFESNRPKAILLEGPPGTGKTLTARILAEEVNCPLVVINLENIVSKWYGDSEKKLAKIFELTEQLDSAILFIDEIDALALSRDSNDQAGGGIHEVSRRILSILLQKLEGFQGKQRNILICTTNRRMDLDNALISRFDLILNYPLPDYTTREAILKKYAKHLQQTPQGKPSTDIYSQLSTAAEGLSCRDLKEACEHAERICAYRYLKTKGSSYRGEIKLTEVDLPTVQDYLHAIDRKVLERRADSIHSQRHHYA